MTKSRQQLMRLKSMYIFHGAHLCLGVGTGSESLPFWEYFVFGLPVKCIQAIRKKKLAMRITPGFNGI